jgi:hypothetical protein
MKRFFIGFIVGLAGFVLSNIASHYSRSSPSGMTDGVHYYGFPFAIWTEGGLPRFEDFRSEAIWYDVAVALVVGVAVGIYWEKRVQF